jgi:hypothetical protein
LGDGGLVQLSQPLAFAGLSTLVVPDGAGHVMGGARGLVLRVLKGGQLGPTFGQDGVAAHGPDGFYVVAVVL